MHRRFILALCLLALPARGQTPVATAMDVAPTLIELKPGAAGLFYVTNHGARTVSVEIEPMDWRQQSAGEKTCEAASGGACEQDDIRDVLTPSTELFASPPLAVIAPGARQSVRLLATPADARAHSYRLLVSELPDLGRDQGTVKVQLQFSVPVFVGAKKLKGGAPALRWNAAAAGDALKVSVTNVSAAPVKLAAPALSGVPLAQGPVYVLPGVRRTFAVRAATSLHVTAHDMLSGRDLDADADAAPLP